MKYLPILLLILISCSDDAMEVTADGLGCNECVVRDSTGQVISMDTTELQNFLIPGWCERLAQWDLTCDCWHVKCPWEH